MQPRLKGKGAQRLIYGVGWGRKKAPKEGQALGKVSRRLLAFKNDAKDYGKGCIDHGFTHTACFFCLFVGLFSAHHSSQPCFSLRLQIS